MALALALQITAEEYRLLPETGPRYQLIEGELHMAPAPDRYHQDISGNIYFLLRRFLEKHPLGKLYDAPFDVYLGEHDAFQPDLLFVSKARLDILTDTGAEGAPDFVVEILSKRTARLDKSPKKKIYAATGVKELWIVDPWKRTIEVFWLPASAEHPRAVYSEKDTFTSPCFPGLRVSAAEIFQR
jgi:Uma2 family endonuclease